MNLFIVLLPYLFLIGSFFLLKPFMCISRKLATIFVPAVFPRVQMGAEHQRKARNGNYILKQINTVTRLLIFGLLLFTLITVFLFITQFLIAAKPSENYQTLQKNANTVIAFGFGIEENKDGKLSAGPANDTIMKWVMDNTNPKYKIAQKGCEISKYQNFNSQIIEMHPHGKNYISTFEAAAYALQKLDSLRKNHYLSNSDVVIIAHNYQLDRAVWIIKKIAEKKYSNSGFRFIIPDLPQMPFASNSSQLHTKNKYIYLLVELYISRPRDYFKMMFDE
jgi:hypothetical protein